MQAMPLTMIFDEKKNMKMGLNKLTKVITIHWAHVITKSLKKWISQVPYVFWITDQVILHSAVAYQKEVQRDHDEMEDIFPQLENSIRVRTRYFDYFIRNIRGPRKFVIQGVGCDARIYNPTGFKKHDSDLEVGNYLVSRKGKVCNPLLSVSAEAS